MGARQSTATSHLDALVQIGMMQRSVDALVRRAEQGAKRAREKARAAFEAREAPVARAYASSALSYDDLKVRYVRLSQRLHMLDISVRERGALTGNIPTLVAALGRATLVSPEANSVNLENLESIMTDMEKSAGCTVRAMDAPDHNRTAEVMAAMEMDAFGDLNALEENLPPVPEASARRA